MTNLKEILPDLRIERFNLEGQHINMAGSYKNCVIKVVSGDGITTFALSSGSRESFFDLFNEVKSEGILNASDLSCSSPWFELRH